MIKNAIISALIVCMLQPIWIPGTSTLHKVISNAAFFYVLMVTCWKVESWIRERSKDER